ncbi:MAG: TetR/AcrR family transcriptional regulator [Clostridiales bacterium]|nr:TetR/AcrR family transcriptional regulator [Clostridiales bacterium]
MEEAMTTKDKIEKTALDMFSKRGYRAVSIRDICKEVGIKESTIYYYYKSKKDIMDSLIMKVNQLIDVMKERFNLQFEAVTEITEDDMCQVAVAYFMNYYMNPFVHQMLSFLTIERMSDPNAADVYQKIVFELPLKQQETVFEKMMERGFIRENSVTVLAQQYNAIIYFAFQKNCMSGSITEEQKRLSREEISNNMRDFYSKMR